MNNNPIKFTDPTGAAPEDIIIQGSDSKKWTIKAPGKDVTYNVPFSLKENKTLDLGISKLADGERYAVGYTMNLGASASVGSGGGGSVDLSVVNFKNSTYGGYNYTYAGAGFNASVGVQEGASAAVGVNFLVAINTNDKLNSFNTDPKTFEGATQSFGVSQDLKAVVGGGWNLSGFSMSDWKGISFGVSVGVGESANAGAAHGGFSTSTLLNNVKPTKDRNFIDRAFNAQYPVSSGLIDFMGRILTPAASPHRIIDSPLPNQKQPGNIL